MITRKDLPDILHHYTGHGEFIGIELGVAEGIFSKALLETGKFKRLYLIDRWNDHHHIGEYFDTLMSLLNTEAIVIRATFEEALSLFGNESLRFVYIDGYAHTGQEGGQTLYDWWPKLRPGGMFAGHDYHKRWPETIKAVDAFMEKKGLKFFLTEEKAPQFPSWYTFKP